MIERAGQAAASTWELLLRSLSGARDDAQSSLINSPVSDLLQARLQPHQYIARAQSSFQWSACAFHSASHARSAVPRKSQKTK